MAHLKRRCKYCQEPAVISLPYATLSVCKDHFIEFFEHRVLQTIEKKHMFRKDEAVCVALSGGKDSMSLLFLLKAQGFQVFASHIDMGLGILSEVSLKIVREFTATLGVPLTVVSAKEELGKGLKESSRMLKRHICSVCGMVRRYILNREGLAYSCVATAHTLDDESAFLLGALYTAQPEYDDMHGPVLEAMPKFARKVKPFCFMSEREIRLYAQLKEIPFVRDRCPYGVEATTHHYKKVLEYLEEKMPSSKLRFYKSMLRRKSVGKAAEEVIKGFCARCGFPTPQEVCGCCRLKEKINERIEDRR